MSKQFSDFRAELKETELTDKVGKWVADKISGKPEDNVVKAKSPEVSRKAPDMGPKTTVPAKTGGGMVSFPASTKTSSTPKPQPVAQKAIPKIPTTPTQQKPVTKTPIKKPESDPNAGGGFVTAKAYGSNKSGITSTENRFGTNKSTFMTPTPQGRVKPAETQSQKDTRLAAQGFKKF